MEEPGRISLITEITARVTALERSERLFIAEVRDDGLTVWTIGLDLAGTPLCTFQGPTPWSRLAPDGIVSEAQFDQLVKADARLIIVHTDATGGTASEQAVNWYRDAFPYAPVYYCATADMRDLLRETLAELPLAQWYELVVLETSRTGRPLLSPLPLFPPGAQRGITTELRVRCEDSDKNGTVFAVVARGGSYRYSLVFAHSVRVPPGEYKLTALLTRPGHVRFEGIGQPFRPDTRSWSEIIATIPDHIELAKDPVHLICLIEVDGLAVRTHRRIDLAGRVVEEAIGATGGRVKVSLISYGSHAFDRRVRDEPPMVWAWEAAGAATRAALSELRITSGVAQDSYHRAAQLEDALAEVTRRLSGPAGRPALVAIGSRPPFPPRVDLATEILPCPHRYDWRQAVLRLREHSGITFGAIRDEPDGGGTVGTEIWRLLGSDAAARPADLNPRQFVADLGLLSPAARYVPFPLVDSSAM